MALPVYVDAGAPASGAGALTPGMPAHVANDVLLLVVNNTYTTITDATLSDAQGFVAVPGGAVNSGSVAGLRSHATVFWKRATSGAEVAPTVAVNGEVSAARIYSFRGCITSGDPWNVVSSTGDNDNNLSMSAAGSTTTVADCLIVVAVTNFNNSAGGDSLAGWANADLTNVVERDDTAFLLAERIQLALTTGERVAPGAFGASTATWSGSANTIATAAVVVALKGAAADATPASLGGIMTILLLARQGGRRERQLVYGKKHPMRRK